MEEIIIIGAGAAGLMAANELSGGKFKVVILEANERLGGRIHTIHAPKFEKPVERGAEFIHGELPLTMELLKKAKLDHKAVAGKMFRSEGGKLEEQNAFAEDWQELMEKMNELREDLVFTDFLDQNFSEKKYKELRETATRFAEGFDAADINKISTISLRAEWMEEDYEQYHIPGGFNQLVNYLADECRKKNGSILTDQKVEKIEWKKNKVVVSVEKGKSFIANKVIITVPLGILQAEPSQIIFQPAIDHYLAAAKKIGFGNVVKVLLQFKEPFWKKKNKNIGFIFSKQQIPTWWTQSAINENLLTGWAGGGQAARIHNASDAELFDMALDSLSKIFDMNTAELGVLFTAATVANWKNDPFSKGAYSFDMVETIEARKVLNTPIDDTIFFAGEGLYEGSSPGTVEAALVSGRNVANALMKIEPV